ncbi:MAG: DUF2461 domain-containing protein [Acidobacteriota bacterium]
MSENPLGKSLFTFLRDLQENNDRDWFNANKKRYEREVKEPALQLISDFGPRLRKVSRHIDAIPKAVGGSLFRIYRDTRFSKDKTPYKTHAGIQFRHQQGKDVHAPGYYLHLEPGQVFFGGGIYHPDSATLKAIREALDDRTAAWKKLRKDLGDDESSGKTFHLAGDSLKRPPRGYDADHPLIDDLKRKDFIAITHLTEKDALAPGLLDRLEALCRQTAPLMRFLCKAVDVPF